MVDVIIRLLMALEAVVCLMLIGVILIQRSKGQGIGLSFGGGAAESVFGGQMGNVLTRTTVILAFVFLVNTTVLAILKPRGSSASVIDRIPDPAAQTVADDSVAAAEPAPSDEEVAAALADEPAPVAAPAATPEEAPAAPAAAPAATPEEAPAAPAAAPAATPEEAPAASADVPAVEAPATEAAPEADITAAAPAAAPAAE